MAETSRPGRVLPRAAGFLAAAAVVALLVVFGRFFFPAEEQMLTPPLKTPEEVTYDTWKAAKGRIENRVACRGYFQPERQYDVSFRDREGYLRALRVKSGGNVKQGEVIATLDIDSLANELKQQELALQGSLESTERLVALSKLEESTAELQLEELRDDLQVKRSLSDSVPGKELRKLENQVKIQENQYRKLVTDYEYQISSSRRQTETIRLKIEELKLEVDKSTIRAPIAGTVTYLAAVEEGEFVQAYKVIATVSEPGRLILEYSGVQHDGFHLGMKVRARLGDDGVYDGEVVFTPLQAPQAEYEKYKETIRVRVKGLPGTCEQGDSGEIEAVLDWADDVIVIPKRLVHQYSGRWFVKVLEDGIVNERDIEVGIESSTDYEIRGGLEPGELVVE